MQSLRCLFMMPYGVYCDTLHRLRSVQSLQLPLFLYEISITLNASFNQAEQLKSVSIYDGAEFLKKFPRRGHKSDALARSTLQNAKKET